MATSNDQKARLLNSLACSLADECSGLTVATQQLYEAFDAFTQPGNQSARSAERVSQCLHEIWVQVSQAVFRNI